MNSIEVTLLMVGLVSTSLVILWQNLTAVNLMGPQTHNGVRWAYVLKSAGHFGMILAVFDYLHGDPRAWPWLLLGSVVTTNTGRVLLQIVTRRECHCPECPVRRNRVACQRGRAPE